MSTHHRPYSIRLQSRACPPSCCCPRAVSPETFIARQEAMIQAGTHAMIAERLALDAMRNQAERERRAQPAGSRPLPDRDRPSRCPARETPVYLTICRLHLAPIAYST